MTEFVLPTTRYARSDEVSIAYQVIGEGPLDLILVPGIVSHVEFRHEFPGYTDYLRHLASFARVISFDKRGQGLSDRVPGVPSLEQRMDDVAAVMEAIGWTVLKTWSIGGISDSIGLNGFGAKACVDSQGFSISMIG